MFDIFSKLKKSRVAIAVGLILAGLVCVCLGYGLAVYRGAGQGKTYGLTELRDQDANNRYIRPLLAVDYPPDLKNFFEFQLLQKQLDDYTGKLVKDGTVKRISVYFRDLQDSRWAGVNENEKFDPASLLKVPIMIAYYKEAETDPTVLGKKLAYDPSQLSFANVNENEDVLVAGQTYTVDDLIRRMIVYSNNMASALLLQNIDVHAFDEIFSDLGIDSPLDQTAATVGQYGISAKNYSFFFRLLRNASYLNSQMSEKALDLLTQTTFHDGLEAGLPAGIETVHKFGVHYNKTGGVVTSTELHDCGIVYTPKNYFLCVMTEGVDLSALKQSIRDVSEMVYNDVK